MASFELLVEGLDAGYGHLAVVRDFSISIREGERVGLLGRNGAGKTTVLAGVVGLAAQLGGRISLGGKSLAGVATHKRCRMGLGYVPQAREIFPSLTVEENLVSALNGEPAAPSLQRAYALFPRLKERSRNGGAQLSGGEQQMLAVARALMGRPKILLLDEPLEGLAPQVRDELMARIRLMTEETGVGCLLVEQHVDVVLDFATKVVILENGDTVFSGDPRELREKPEILAGSLGLKKL